jgi:hypothetical protein
MTLEGGIDQLKKIVQRKSPNTFKQLEAAAENPQALPETVEMMATLIEEDEEVKAVTEKVAEENKDNAKVIQEINNLGNRIGKQININQSGTGNTQNNTFTL